MTQHILIGTDFSEHSELAFPHAVRLARTLQLPIRLLHVSDALPPTAALPTVPHKPWEADMLKYIESRLAALADDLRQHGVEVETRHRPGLPARELLEELNDEISVAVLAIHGRTGIRRLIMGSVVSKVIRRSTRPVLTVGPEAEDRPIDLILLPTDFSEVTTGALHDALDLAASFNARVEFFHCIPPHQMSDIGYAELLANIPTEGAPEEVPEQCQRALDELAAHARTAGVEATTALATEQRPADAICERIEAGEVDLVIMPAHGYTGFSRLLLGSVAEEVVRSVSRPVLVLKPEQTVHDLREV